MPGKMELSKKITIFGLGTTGTIVLFLLQKMGIFSQVICIDVNMKKAQNEISDWADWTKVLLIKASFPFDEKLTRRLQGSFVIINAASSTLNIPIMKLAWQIGAHYLDLSSLNNFVAEQLSFSERFIKNGLIALINAGLGPGLTNLMADALIRGLINCIVKIYVAETTDCDEDIFLWSIPLALDEGLSEVPHFGKAKAKEKTRRPFSQQEFVNFPEPIGRIECGLVNENEGITMKDLPNIREIETKAGGSDIERLKSLLRTLLKRNTKNDTENRVKKLLSILPPPPPSKEVIGLIKQAALRESRVGIVVTVKGLNPATEKTEWRKIQWISPGLIDLQSIFPGAIPLRWCTAFMAVLFIERLLDSKLIQPGVWPPEKLPQEDQDIILARSQNMLTYP
ncbi:MAG: saccharopine dehydrogenase NADP-binding domain-containing protein [bacterium]